MLDRRRLLLGSATLAMTCTSGAGTRADEGLFPLEDDNGRPAFNYRLPAELPVDDVPGVLRVGAKTPTAELIEFFDYNCPHCRTASRDIITLLHVDPELRLGLVNHPICGPGSVQAAKVQHAVLRGYGPDTAFSFHEGLLARRGPTDGPAALQTAGDLGLDAAALQKAADLPQVSEAIRRQTDLANALGFDATPSFMIDGLGITGYPGPKALASAVAATRKCDKLVC